ncbi:histidine kinase [Clostridium sp. OS1-26]|uniref:histidine kinase n=1 Tax=Clostridium sp. OS1-26 TaxID=3070681 RepID=UPI0027DF01C8|nr:histidine kinase [Clostridium sp. OS1-26]WML35382.1 histidine kinase [Clostridium sp. OS1-26]
MDKLLTKKDLAIKWQLDERTIDKYRTEGILTPCKGIPAIRFSSQYIAELEGVKLEKFSPIEKRRLERELEEIRKERDYLRQILNNIISESSKVFDLSKQSNI